MRLFVGLVVAALAGCAASGSHPAHETGVAGPRFHALGPDADDYGARAGYPIGDRTTFFQIPYLVGSHSQLDSLFDSRLIRRAATPSPLARATPERTIRYLYKLRWLTLDDYLARNPTTGLLIAHGDTILAERYQYGRSDRHRFTSWSMAKTVTAMLIGIAIAEGRIRSVDDPAATYVPGLAGTEYGTTSIRHLLQMSSGVRFLENYSGRDDVSKLSAATLGQRGAGGVDAVTPYNEREVPAGTKFSYASVETQVLGLVLRAAVGRPVADYLHEKIWEPIGAEADATWIVDRSGQEATYCCLNAVLRDYARLGLLLAHDGQWRGRQIIPAAWVREATTPSAAQRHLQPEVATRFYGYGYQTWILPGDRRQFAFLGVRGQAIFVDVPSRLVVVHTAVRKLPSDPAGAETVWLFKSLVHTLGG
jgi:CubicO group peptidase (beta-lactamase class C family)